VPSPGTGGWTWNTENDVVFLDRIYTRAGDDGETSLGDGTRVAKQHPRIATYGGTDELNSIIGLARAVGVPEMVDTRLARIQNDLFDLGADLCVPGSADDQPEPEHPPLRVAPGQVDRLESWIDEVNGQLEPLTSFVLPGGSVASAWLHLARTVCRRVEIAVWTLHETESVNGNIPRYLNRLSDLLFVFAQLCNDGGRSGVLWVPGQNRE